MEIVKLSPDEQKQILPLLGRCFPEYWEQLAAKEQKMPFDEISFAAYKNGILCGHCGEVAEVETAAVFVNIGTCLMYVISENLLESCLNKVSSTVVSLCSKSFCTINRHYTLVALFNHTALNYADMFPFLISSFFCSDNTDYAV